MTKKQQLYQNCINMVNQRLLVCEKNLAIIQESLASETKSSAGDKHETGRAMIQLEREQLGVQLAAIEADQSILLRVNPSVAFKTVGLGSLVRTSEYSYFIAISAGKMTIHDQNYYFISLNSPIGQILNGKKVGDQLNFRDKKMEILEIY